MRSVCVGVLVGLTVAGCGLAHRDLQERTAALDAQSQAAGQACDTKFPSGNPKTAVARARCQMGALEIRRTIMPNPDLLDSFIGTLISAAEQVQSGQLTFARANEIVANKYSELVRVFAVRTSEIQIACSCRTEYRRLPGSQRTKSRVNEISAIAAINP
jgi:hypothetical protein